MDETKTDAVLKHRFWKKQPNPILPGVPVPHPSDDYIAANAIPIPKPKRPVGSGIMFAFGRLIFNLGATPFWEKNLTTLFYGPRSQGKSLHQAKTVEKIFKYLDALYRFYPDLPQACVVSNQKFNQEIEGKYLGNRLFYWESIQQLKFCPRDNCWKAEYENVQLRKLKGGVPRPPMKRLIPHRLHDCYIIMDDAATIIPADGWQDLPLWFRKLWAQAGHNGIHCLANIQDPVSCDINFRRYTDIAFKFNKVMGNRRPEPAKPKVDWIWGIYTSREIPADELWMNGDKSEREIEQEKIDREERESLAKVAGRKVVKVAQHNWKRRYHIIRKRDTLLYDTLQNIPQYMPNTLEHIELNCIDPNCKLNKKGHGHVRHRVI
jgi:hypothetical protein